MTHTITLDPDDGDALSELAAAYPGITLHLAHFAVFRLGLRAASGDHTLLADELTAISEERRERRRRARTGKNGSALADENGRDGANNV